MTPSLPLVGEVELLTPTLHVKKLKVRVVHVIHLFEFYFMASLCWVQHSATGSRPPAIQNPNHGHTLIRYIIIYYVINIYMYISYILYITYYIIHMYIDINLCIINIYIISHH